MGEAGFGTAMYGEDTETHEVEHGEAGETADEEDEFGFDDTDDSAAYSEMSDDMFDAGDDL